MLPDYHIHTFHSGDNNEQPERCCEQAIKLGLKEICFTDHFEPDPTSFLHNKLNIERYINHISQLRSQWAGKLDIKIGLEIGWARGCDSAIERVISKYDFDYLLGSIHFVDGISTAYAPELYPLFKKTPDFRDILDPVFNALYCSVNSGLFHSIGHADLIFTHACVHYKDLTWEFYEKQVEDIVSLAVQKSIIFEVNTGGLRCGFPDTTPESWFLKKYAQAGGKHVILGSDAHVADDIGSDFDRAAEIVASLDLNILETGKHFKG